MLEMPRHFVERLLVTPPQSGRPSAAEVSDREVFVAMPEGGHDACGAAFAAALREPSARQFQSCRRN